MSSASQAPGDLRAPRRRAAADEARRAECQERERRERAAAESAALARDQLLAMVSHELRSPLNGIKSWAHVLERQLRASQGDATVERALAGILLGVDQQAQLIDHLLDAARVLSGTFNPARHPMQLAPALDEAVDGLRAAAESKGVRIALDNGAMAAQIHGDFARVQRIFASIIDNAIKFSPPGAEIRVSLAVDGAMACIEVRDQGAGIARKFLPYVFDPFRPADHGTHRRAHGMGLGLAVAQRLAELHGGHIACSSEGPGKGAIFRVVLPLRRDVVPGTPGPTTAD